MLLGISEADVPSASSGSQETSFLASECPSVFVFMPTVVVS